MDEEQNSRTTSRMGSPPKWAHLKPLSVYSRRVICDQKTCVQPPQMLSNPFINFKIELVSNGTSKRKMDDSSVDDGYETPAKKPCTTKTLSPDLGCFMDYCSPLTRQESVSHFSTDPGGEVETVSSSFQGERVLSSLGLTFDCDVDGFSDNVESCKSPQRNILPNVAHTQVEEKGDGQVKEGREELKKDMCVNVVEVKDYKGYFSVSSFNDHKIGANPPDPVPSQLSKATSSPLLRTAEAELSQDTFPPESSSEPRCHEQAVISGLSIVDHLCPSVSGPLLEPVISPLECLQGAEEMLEIGPPIFESSVCEGVTVKLNATSEQSGLGPEKTQEDVTDSVHDFQDTACDSSASTTLPLQVQVKSKVVIPTTSSKPVVPLPPGQNIELTKSNSNKDRTVQTAKHVKSQRSGILNREVDWEQKKNLYVRSVTQHMTESPGANHGRNLVSQRGVMSELLSLMSHVADQTTGSNGTQWQHPSDLTRRNYQRRFGNATPKMALLDWLAKNSPTHKRFARVPKIFERTQFP